MFVGTGCIDPTFTDGVVTLGVEGESASKTDSVRKF
jgi:hypothetical protein